MKIINVYSSYFPDNGGIQKVIKCISEEFIQQGHDAKVICFTDKDYKSIENINGVEVYRIKDPLFKYSFEYSFSFYKFLRLYSSLFSEADVINIHSYHTLMSWQIIKLLEKNGYGDKIVFTPHYEGIGFTKIKDIMHRFYRLIAKSSFSIPQKIICVSDYEMRILTTTFDIPNEKIVVIPNGVDYNFPRETVKKIKGDNLKILYVGRLREYKGVQYILRSLRYIQDNYSYNIEFTVVGNGDYEDNLRNLTEKLNLDCVNYLGSVSKDELDELYSTSDLFILPSKSECYGIVVAEALANGLITIVSKETALIEFLSESGCFGIEYPPNCTELGELICNFVNKEISIGPFSNKICQWNNVANNYISVYMSIN